MPAPPQRLLTVLDNAIRRRNKLLYVRLSNQSNRTYLVNDPRGLIISASLGRVQAEAGKLLLGP